jgi:peptidoglycan/LPS O-acetylase OafA/YrhL
MVEQGKGTRHFLALDGLRGIAALGVVGTHILGHLLTKLQLPHAYLAVDFFFMLSGFVIAHAYDKRLAGGTGIFDFLQIRLIRLYPLILLGIVLGACALIAGGISVTAVLKAAFTNMALLPTPVLLHVRPLAFPVNSPMWSLAFELWINILYAALFRYLTKTTILTCMALGAIATILTCVKYHGLNVGFNYADYYLGIVRVLFPFLAGILLGRSFANRSHTMRWSHFTAPALLLILVMPGFQNRFYDSFAVLILFPVILIAAAQAAPSPRLDPLWRFLGNISYPLYATHYPLVVVCSTLVHRFHLNVTLTYIAAIFMLIAAIALSILALQLYDLPVRNLLSSLRQRRVSARTFKPLGVRSPVTINDIPKSADGTHKG